MARSHPSSFHHLHPFLLSLVVALSYSPSTSAAPSSTVGVNYGQIGSDLPSPTTSLRLIRALRAGSVKLYDANPAILRALSGTGLKVAIMVPNQLIPTLATNRSAADAWVAANLVPFLPGARVRYLLVGNEVLSDPSVRSTAWPALVPAMYSIKAALEGGAAGARPAVRDALRRIKVGTTVAVDALLNGSYSRPPSSARFRPEYAEAVVKPLLRFLKKTNSFYFLDAYTYFSWAPARATIPLGYALLEEAQQPYVDPGTGLRYANLLQELLDAVAYAMARLGYPDLRLALAETGWPNGGDYDQAGANPRNAAIYNRNLARWARAGLGTPLRPAGNGKGKGSTTVPVWVFSLYNENLKPGPGTERHWGMYYPTTSPVYGVDLSGRTPDGALPPLPPAAPEGPYKGKIWCVVARAIKPGTNATEIGNAVAYACGQGNGTCAALQPQARSPCASGTVVQRASYAFNSYWQQFRGVGATCYFNGLAEQVIRDPSYGSCRFPSLSG